MNNPNPELVKRLQSAFDGDVYGDIFSRGRYATDASIYQMMPVAVAAPRHVDDIQAAISIAHECDVPVTPRGGGTSQCGQAINHSLVLDNSRYLNRVLKLDVENQRCVVEPGIVLDELNRLLKPHGLWFPVDVSTASRATIGGMAANNSCGQRSIYYGTMRHNVHAIDAVLPSGEQCRFASLDATHDRQHSPGPDAGGPDHASLVNELLALAGREADEITRRFPDVLRRVGGYNLDALLASGQPANLAHLLVGSEGTLAYSTAIELKLWPLPLQRVLGVCHFPTFYQAMDATQHLVELGPHAVELVDSTMIALARDIALYRPSVEEFVRGEPAAVLLVEFAFESQDQNLRHLELLHERMADLGFGWKGQGSSWGGVVDAVDTGMQARIGEVRKAGLNIMMSMKSDGKPVSFVEDCAVELGDLAEYTAALTEIFTRHNTEGTWYAHASVGCLHVRPVLNMKLEKDANTMREIADEAFELVLKYKGSHSGEHGDGISRSEFHEKMFGTQLVRAFEQVKTLFDPDNQFNPGKIVHAPRMNERSLFRYNPGYRVLPIANELDWSDWTGEGGGLQGAIEMCNNNGACRKLKGGVMCPSYRVTRNEKDVTRGRANTLRLALSGQLGPDALVSEAMHDSLKLCVSCKGCKRECPTGVDMARMKIEVQAARARRYGFSLHDRLVANLPRYAPVASRLRLFANLRNRFGWLAKLTEGLTGFAADRSLPEWHAHPFTTTASSAAATREVVLLADTFNTWFEPENLRAATRVLHAAGYQVHIAAAPGRSPRRLCCGRTYLSCGMLDQAREEATRMIEALLPWAERGVPVVGLEPSCLLTLRDEYLALLPGDNTSKVAANAYLLEELLARDADAGKLTWHLGTPVKKVLLHGHCHQKALGAFTAVQRTLALIPNLQVETIESSCCGMAGAFGYATDTAPIAKEMAELDILPAVRAASPDTLLVADGTSCRHQIELGGGRSATHVAQVLDRALGMNATTVKQEQV